MLLLLLCILKVYEAHLREIEDDHVLPSNLRMLLQIILQRLDKNVFEMNQRFFNDGQKRSRSLEIKFMLIFTNCEVIAKLTERLRDAERDLTLLTGLLNMYVFLELYRLLFLTSSKKDLIGRIRFAPGD